MVDMQQSLAAPAAAGPHTGGLEDDMPRKREVWYHAVSYSSARAVPDVRSFEDQGDMNRWVARERARLEQEARARKEKGISDPGPGKVMVIGPKQVNKILRGWGPGVRMQVKRQKPDEAAVARAAAAAARAKAKAAAPGKKPSKSTSTKAKRA